LSSIFSEGFSTVPATLPLPMSFTIRGPIQASAVAAKEVGLPQPGHDGSNVPSLAEEDEVVVITAQEDEANTTAAIEGQDVIMQQMPLIAGVGAQ
jgi:hypothetical protein